MLVRISIKHDGQPIINYYGPPNPADIGSKPFSRQPLVPGVLRDEAFLEYFLWQKRQYSGTLYDLEAVRYAFGILKNHLFDIDALHQGTNAEELVDLGIRKGLAKALICDVDSFLYIYTIKA